MNEIRMRYLSKPVVLVVLFCVASFTDATSQVLSFGGQIKPRTEFRNGFKTLTEEGRDPAFFTEQRTRLWTDFKTDKMRIKITMHDIRMWGSVNQAYRTDPNLTGIFEAWAEYYFSPKVSLKIGRQPIHYDNDRLLGLRPWPAQSRSDDAFVLKYEGTNGLKVHTGIAFNQNYTPIEPIKLSGTFYTAANYKTMQYLWVNKKTDAGSISFTFHNDGRQVASDSSVAFRQSYGLSGHRFLSLTKVGGDLYYQGGKGLLGESVSGLLASIYITQIFNNTPLTLGIDYLSGTSMNDTRNKSFMPLYSTRHRYYGHMDYFYVGNFHGQGIYPGGLVDLYLKSAFKLGDITTLNGHLHYFNSSSQVYDPTDSNVEISNYLGTEIDLFVVFKPVKDLIITLGYSQMFAGESMEAVKPIPGDHAVLNNWAYLMFDFSPTFFTRNFSE